MCVLMMRSSLHGRAASACGQYCCFTLHSCRAAFLLLLILACAFLVIVSSPTSSNYSMHHSELPIETASSTPSESLRIQAPIFSNQADHEKLQSQAPLIHQGEVMQFHRKLGFNLEKAYEMLKRSCQGVNCRRRPAFHILHDVPSGPNPISNYLPSTFYDRFRSWAPAPPPF